MSGWEPLTADGPAGWGPSVLLWRLRLLGLAPSGPAVRLAAGGLLVFSLCTLAIKVAQLGQDDDNLDRYMDGLAALPAAAGLVAWWFAWCVVQPDIYGRALPPAAGPRLSGTEMAMTASSGMLTVCLAVGGWERGHSLGERMALLVLFLLLSTVVTLPQIAVIGLLQLRCVGCEQKLDEHVACPGPLRPLHARVEAAAREWRAYLACSSSVCAATVVLNALLVLLADNKDSPDGHNAVRAIPLVGFSVFFTVVLLAQLVPVALLNRRLLTSPEKAVLDLDEADSAECGDRMMLKLLALRACPPRFRILGFAIMPSTLVKAFISILSGNILALVYSSIKGSLHY